MAHTSLSSLRNDDFLAHENSLRAIGPPFSTTASDYDPSEVSRWSKAQVAQWLRRRQFGHYERAFAENDITGDVLLELDNDLLKELSVNTVGQRVKLLVAVRELKKEAGNARKLRRSSRSVENGGRSLEAGGSDNEKRLIGTGGTKNGGENDEDRRSRRDSRHSQERIESQELRTYATGVPRKGSVGQHAMFARPTIVTGNTITAAITTDHGAGGVGGGNGGEAQRYSLQPSRSTSLLHGTKARSNEGLHQRQWSLASLTGDAVPIQDLKITSSDASLGSPYPSTPATAKESVKSLDSLKQECIRVVGAEGQSRMVNLDRNATAKDILAKILRKFNIREPADRFALFVAASGEEGGSVKPLTDEQILEICFSADRPEKERLVLRKRHLPVSHDDFKRQGTVRNKMRKLENFFGEKPPKSNSQTKLDKFFGERPPSDLISSNLAEYFPGHKGGVLRSRFAKRKSKKVRVIAPASPSPSPPPNPSVPAAASSSSSSLPNINLTGSIRKNLDRRRNGHLTIFTGVESNSDSDVHSDDSHGKSGSHAIASMPSSPSTPSSATTRIGRNGGSRGKIDDADEDPDGEEDGEEEEGEEDDEETAISPTGTSLIGDGGGADGSVSVRGPVKGEQEIRWMKGALIGTGSYGSVYLGLNSRNGELMAVKQVELPSPASTSPTTISSNTSSTLQDGASVASSSSSATDPRKHLMLDALQREIALLKELHHVNIVRYLGSQSDHRHLNIFLEYVPGGSVAGLLSRWGPFGAEMVQRYVVQILAGLAYLHHRDIIHRDIKGGNILVDNKGGVKISDFGISKKVEDNILRLSAAAAAFATRDGSEERNDESAAAGVVVAPALVASLRDHRRASLQGSVFWMAPEVVKQTHYTRKADVWSLGCLVVEMFTAEHPFPADDETQAMFRIGRHAVPHIPETIPDSAKDFLSRTFIHDHRDRPSADDLRRHPFVVDIDASNS